LFSSGDEMISAIKHGKHEEAFVRITPSPDAPTASSGEFDSAKQE